MMTAAVSTNIATEMVKRAEEEFMKLRLPEAIGSWGEVDLTRAWFGHCCARDGIQPSDVTKDWKTSLAHMEAWEQCEESYMYLRSLVGVYSLGTVPNQTGINSSYPFTRPARLGSYNPELEFDECSPKKQYEQMGALLNDMLVTVGALLCVSGTPSSPCDDMLMQGLRDLQVNDILPPMWLLFACQNFLDIHFILKTRSERPYEELRDFAISARQTLKQHQAFIQKHPLPNMRDQDAAPRCPGPCQRKHCRLMQV